MSLHLFSPGPFPLRLAGCDYRARPLRVGDLYALADLAARQVRRPGRPGPGEADDPAYRRALRAHFDAAEAWPPEWGRALDTDEGMGLVLAATLREDGVTEEELAGLACLMTAEEWADLQAIAFGADPLLEAAATIDQLLGSGPADGGSWEKSIAAVCLALGKLPAEVATMTLPEFRLVAQRGERMPAGGDVDHSLMLRRERFWGEDAPTSESPDQPPPAASPP
jgi:hypothetical protein